MSWVDAPTVPGDWQDQLWILYQGVWDDSQAWDDLSIWLDSTEWVEESSNG